MQHVSLNNGMTMPSVGLGTYSLRGERCVETVSLALDLGYRLLDTASLYANEAEVAQGIRRSGVARDKIFLTTKLYPPQYAKAAAAIDAALKRMGVDYIDMLMLHHPAGNDVAAYQAIETAIAAGKVRCAGISCYYRSEYETFRFKIGIKPVVVQNEIHPYYQDTDNVRYLQAQGLIVQAWYPLGGRGYTGKLLSDATVVALADKHGVSCAQLILRWDLERGVCVIPGSSSREHLQQNLQIFAFSLDDEDMQALAALERREKHDWY